MNRPTELRFATFGSLLCFLAFAPGATAQINNPSAAAVDDELIELSPFRVDSSRDRGYSVARDVSGSRLATDLKDIAAPITVFNAEMLQDIGAINVNEALDFAPNTAYQEFGINNQDFNQVPITTRGLTGATVTQDFFPVFDELDTYKVDRIGFGRGPNSILFGVGVPGGTITATTKQANLKRNAFETQVRFDSVGSMRGLFDASYLIKEDRAAIRAVVMQQYQTKLPRPQYRKDLRVFLDRHGEARGSSRTPHDAPRQLRADRWQRSVSKRWIAAQWRGQLDRGRPSDLVGDSRGQFADASARHGESFLGPAARLHQRSGESRHPDHELAEHASGQRHERSGAG